MTLLDVRSMYGYLGRWYPSHFSTSTDFRNPGTYHSTYMIQTIGHFTWQTTNTQSTQSGPWVCCKRRAQRRPKQSNKSSVHRYLPSSHSRLSNSLNLHAYRYQIGTSALIIILLLLLFVHLINHNLFIFRLKLSRNVCRVQ